MGVRYKKDGQLRIFDIVDGKARTTIMIDGVWVVNPTVEMLEADGWEKVIVPIPPAPEPILPTIEELVEGKLRERYTINQEFEVQRKRDTEPEEFQAYYNYVEECIAWANEQPHRKEEGV